MPIEGDQDSSQRGTPPPSLRDTSPKDALTRGGGTGRYPCWIRPGPGSTSITSTRKISVLLGGISPLSSSP